MQFHRLNAKWCSMQKKAKPCSIKLVSFVFCHTLQGVYNLKMSRKGQDFADELTRLEWI